MAEKLVEANRVLALQQAREASAEAARRRVTFQDTVIEFASEDGFSSEEDEAVGTGGGMSAAAREDAVEVERDEEAVDVEKCTAGAAAVAGAVAGAIAGAVAGADVQCDQQLAEEVGAEVEEVGAEAEEVAPAEADEEGVVVVAAKVDEEGARVQNNVDDDDDAAVFTTFVKACSLDEEEEEDVGAARDPPSGRNQATWSPFMAVCEDSDVSSGLTSQEDEDVDEVGDVASEAQSLADSGRNSPVDSAAGAGDSPREVDSASDSAPDSPEHDPTVTSITLFSVPVPVPVPAARIGRPKSASRRRPGQVTAGPGSPPASATASESPGSSAPGSSSEAGDSCQ
ncbi:Polycystic kidney disease protein 1-like 3, partial [Frankliniella fusca]